MVTPEQLMKINKKIEKAQVTASRERSLDLSGLSIDSETLHKVMPEILKIQNLSKLDLSKNKLTSLPDNIGELSSLTQLIVKKNNIKNVPYTLAALGNLERLDFCSNPLSSESARRVNSTGQTMLNVDNKYKNALSILYPNDDERAKVADKIESSDLDPVPIISESTSNDYIIQDIVIKSSRSAIKLFLSKIPIHSQYELNLYGPTVKMLLSQLRDPNIPVEDRNSIQLRMISSLGNCDTPVKEYLMRVMIAELLKSGKKLSEENYLMLERLAHIEETGKLKNLLPNEKVEVVNALVSLVYSYKHVQYLAAKTNIHLKFSAEGNNKEKDMAPISGNLDYGLSLLNLDLLEEFGWCKKRGPIL